MYRKFTLAALGFAAVLGLTGAAFAGAGDYAFEAAPAEVKKGDDVTVAVRLVHKPTGKAVPDAVIIRARIDMGPDGMADMVPPVVALPSPEPGVYAFKTDLSMAGRWALSVAAKVQGDPETVVGKVVIKAIK